MYADARSIWRVNSASPNALLTGSWVRVPAGSPLQGRGQMTGGHAVGVIALGGTVSIFAINPLCREVSRDHAFRAAMKVDPVEALNC